MLMVVLDWLRDRRWSLKDDPVVPTPEEKPSNPLKRQRHLANDLDPRRAEDWQIAR